MGSDMNRRAGILLVDDNVMDIELTLHAFQEKQVKNSVQPLTSGQEALNYLFGRGPYADRNVHPLPDLILLDLKMPVIDGHEVLRQIKTSPVLKRTPVIVLTSSREERDRALSYDNGVNSYLVKPVSFEGLLEMVQRIDDYWLSLNVPPPLDAGGVEGMTRIKPEQRDS